MNYRMGERAGELRVCAPPCLAALRFDTARLWLLISAIFLAMLWWGSVYAQQPSSGSSAPGTEASTTQSPSETTVGIRTAGTANVAVRFVAVSPASFMSSRILGSTLYNNQNESIGEIKDLVIENGNRVAGIVVSVGGFLGLGESYVVVDPSTVIINRKDSQWRAFVNTSKETLKNAPKFTYPSERD